MDSPPPTPMLPDEILEEILLRLPPGDPACLARASLVSQIWHGLLTDRRFHRRYSEFHGAPPMLGFFYSLSDKSSPPFVPTTRFGARFPDDWGTGGKYSAWDCRHGRVLLHDRDAISRFLLWDPMTGCRKQLCAPLDYHSLGAAVLCAVSGCDHHACHEGPSKVVFVRLKQTDGDYFAYAHVSLPEQGGQMPSKPCSALHLSSQHHPFFKPGPPVVIQDAVFFMLWYEKDAHAVEILRYDLTSNRLSLHSSPPVFIKDCVHMAMEDGSLGIAHVFRSTLYPWSRQMGSDEDGVGSWTPQSYIDLKKLLPTRNPGERLRLVGSVEDSDTVFVTTDLGIYQLNLKSLRWKKLCKSENFFALFPYMSFYYPPERAIPCVESH